MRPCCEPPLLTHSRLSLSISQRSPLLISSYRTPWDMSRGTGMNRERAQRRLATILAADVVSYSRLMGEDEEATLATLKSHREVIDGLIARDVGRVFGEAPATV